jgi:hypothetical protein
VSLYRQASGVGRGALVALGICCLVIGALAGFAIGRGSAEEPTAAELIADARAQARPALSALELVTIEYPEAVRGGEIVAETEYEAAVAQADSAADTLAAGEDGLGELDPGGLADAEAAVDEVVRRVGEKADVGAVDAAAARATAAVEDLTEAPSAG